MVGVLRRLPGALLRLAEDSCPDCAGRFFASPLGGADSTDCSRLIYQARLINIGLQRGSTQFSFVGLKRLPKGHRPQELRLLSTSRNIAPDYIRPYAICHSPAWLVR